MTTEALSAVTTIAALPDDVFAVLTDPSSHVALSGRAGGTPSVRTGWVEGAIDTAPLTRSGQVFRMGMYHPDHSTGDYVTANQVRRFDPPHTISWATGTEDDAGRLSFGGWFWRYDLTAAGDGGTVVRLTYDWSEATREAREVIGFPPFGIGHLQDSLSRLADYVTSRGPRPGAPGPARSTR
jgi:uncharacterized protein YndB with AHSA1/START domain